MKIIRNGGHPSTWRWVAGIVVILGLVGAGSTVFALEGKAALAGERVAGLYVNAHAMYAQFIGQVKAVDAPENAVVKAVVLQMLAAAQANFVQARERAQKNRGSEGREPAGSAAGAGSDPNGDGLEETGDIEEEAEEGTGAERPLSPGLAVPAEAQKAAEKLLADAIARVLEFDRKAVLVPSGGLWVGVAAKPGVKAILEARCKPLELLAMIEPLLQGAPVKVTARDAAKVVLDLGKAGVQTAPNATVEITADGLVVTALAEAELPAAVGADMAPVVEQAKDRDTLVALEIMGKSLRNLAGGGFSGARAEAQGKACSANMRVMTGAIEMFNMDHEKMATDLDLKALVGQNYLKDEPRCPAQGEYRYLPGKEAGDFTIECSLHGTVEAPKKPSAAVADAASPEARRFAALERIRFVMHPQGSHIKVAVTDPQVKAEGKKMLDGAVAQLRAKAAETKAAMMPPGMTLPSGALEAEQARVQKMLDGVKVIDDGNWIGLRMDDAPPLVLSAGLAGIVAAIAIPNFVKARNEARDRQCRANRMVLESAAEMYGMDHPDGVAKVTIQELIDKQYLKSEPRCSEGGVYAIDTTNMDKMRVRCSKHAGRD